MLSVRHFEPFATPIGDGPAVLAASSKILVALTVRSGLRLWHIDAFAKAPVCYPWHTCFKKPVRPESSEEYLRPIIFGDKSSSTSCFLSAAFWPLAPTLVALDNQGLLHRFQWKSDPLGSHPVHALLKQRLPALKDIEKQLQCTPSAFYGLSFSSDGTYLACTCTAVHGFSYLIILRNERSERHWPQCTWRKHSVLLLSDVVFQVQPCQVSFRLGTHKLYTSVLVRGDMGHFAHQVHEYAVHKDNTTTLKVSTLATSSPFRAMFCDKTLVVLLDNDAWEYARVRHGELDVEDEHHAVRSRYLALHNDMGMTHMPGVGLIVVAQFGHHSARIIVVGEEFSDSSALRLAWVCSVVRQSSRACIKKSSFK